MTRAATPAKAPAAVAEAAPKAPSAETVVVHSEHVVVDNTEAVEEEVVPPEETEADLGDGTVKVSYL